MTEAWIETESPGCSLKLESLGGYGASVPSNAPAKVATADRQMPLREAFEASSHVVSGRMTNEVWCTGYVTIGHNVTVWLSDDRIAHSGAGEVQSVSEYQVRALGQVLTVRIGSAYGPLPINGFDVGEIQSSSRPVNDAQVTYIGGDYNARRAAPLSTGALNPQQYGQTPYPVRYSSQNYTGGE